MRCPYCGSLDDKVLESRTMANGESIRRRRECMSCGYRFTSYERIEEKKFMVVKKDGRRQPFDQAKRPVTSDMIENITNDIYDQAVMIGKTSREIPTEKLGELVLDRLYKTDKVAYIRFTSVYKHFETLDEFIKEIKNSKINEK